MIIYWELMLNLILSLAACAFVSLFILHHPGVIMLLVFIVALIDLDLLGAICESFAWLLQDAYFSDISESRVVGPAPLMVNVRLTLDFCA